MKFIKAFIASFYSPRLYWELARSWEGIGSSLLFLLSFVVVIGFAVAICIGVLGNAKMEEFVHNVPALVDTLPAIQIENGKLSIDKPSPYYLKVGAPPNNATIVIDTNYQDPKISELETYMNTNHVPMIISATKIMTLNKQKLEVTNLDSIKQKVTITHENWQKASAIITKWGLTLMVVFVLLWLFIFMTPILAIFYTIIAFFSAIAVKILSLIMRVSLSFVACMRLASGFRIPVALLGYLFTIIPTSSFVGWVIWVGYLIFAVASVKRGDQAA